MLMRTDPFRELDRLTQQFFGTTPAPGRGRPRCRWTPTAPATSSWSRSTSRRRPRRDRAQRRAQRAHGEGRARPNPVGRTWRCRWPSARSGVFSRQLFLGDTLDTEHINATYEAGVLTLRIPVAEQAKPRQIEISNADKGVRQIDA